jgi:hypothetical protein
MAPKRLEVRRIAFGLVGDWNLAIISAPMCQLHAPFVSGKGWRKHFLPLMNADKHR